jgi:hypothetical protein
LTTTVSQCSKMPTMMDLKIWLEAQGLTVRELAQELDVPLKTAQDWVYRDKVPSSGNQDRLTQYVRATCAHHWMIAPSKKICRRCGQRPEFQKPVDLLPCPTSRGRRATVFSMVVLAITQPSCDRSRQSCHPFGSHSPSSNGTFIETRSPWPIPRVM